MKRNSLFKRFAVGIMALSLVIPAVPASAESSYDPRTESGNHGIYIDTTYIKTMDIINDDIVVEGSRNSETIKTKRNVKFQLDANIDVIWSIDSTPVANDSATKGAVYDYYGSFTLNKYSGEVVIPSNATYGQYIIKATPENVTEGANEVKTITIKVDEKNAKASKVMLDEEKIEAEYAPRLLVEEDSNGKQKLISTGYIQGATLYTKVIPEYICDNIVTHINKSGDSNAHYKYTENNLFETVKATTGELGTSTFKIGDDEFDSYSVEVKKEDFNFDLVTDAKIKTDNSFSFTPDRNVTLEVDENGDTALKTTGLTAAAARDYIIKEAGSNAQDKTAIKWSLFYGEKETAEPPEELDDGSTQYVITGDKTVTSGGNTEIEHPEIATITISKDNRSINVVTTAEKEAEVKTVTLKAEILRLGETDKVPLNFVFKFTKASPVINDIKLNFDDAYTMGKTYNVYNETINDDPTPVYYFETGTKLDLPALTTANEKGVVSFEKAKANGFTNDNTNAYVINYNIKDITEKEIKNFKNDSIKAGGRTLDKEEAKDFELEGTGYIKVDMHIIKPDEGMNQEHVTYYIRTVSSSDNLKQGLYITKKGTTPYQIYNGEVVHIRKGEAIVPKMASKAPTAKDPYLKYSFEPDNSSALAVQDANNNYRISGVESGKVFVTVSGVVDTEDVTGFWLYINEDDYDKVSVAISFDDAINLNMASKAGSTGADNYIINGAQKDIPIKLVTGNNASESTGIPKVTWSLDTNDNSVASIDSTSGKLTTYKSTSSNTSITIKAINTKTNEVCATAKFTIASVGVTSISKIGEKKDANADGVVKGVVDNSGTINVDDEFTIVPISYLPLNATDIQSGVTWRVDNTDVASVNETSGLVKGLTPGEANITAILTVGGNSQDVATFKLTVKEKDIEVEDIDVESTLEIRGIGSDASKKIVAKVIPENAKNQTLTFVSEDENIAKVDGTTGMVTGVSVGKTTVTVKAANGVSKVVTVNVLGVNDNPITEGEANLKDATDKINAIGTVTADDASKARIDAARAAYNKLTEDQKNSLGVSMLNTLTTAESTYATAKKAADDKAAADKAAADKAAAEKAAAEAAAAKAAAEEAAAKNIAATKISLAKNNKSKKILVKVKAISGASGYQVRYSLKKNMKSSKTKNITKTSVTLSKLKKGKTYYIQARSVATYNGTKYYSKWSAKKKVKVKK